MFWRQKISKNLHCLAVHCLNGMLDFLVHPSWAPVANFCRKTALRAVFRQKLATGAHDGWTKKSSMPNPPNNEEHDAFCSLFQIWFIFNKNNWKLVLIITFRNRRIGNFCKKRRPQLHHMYQVQTAKLQNSIEKRCSQQFIPLPKMGHHAPE